MRDRVSEREKLRISGIYFSAAGEVEKEAQTYELWEANYPRDPLPPGNLGVNYSAMGQYDKALVAYKEALGLGGENVFNYSNLGSSGEFVVKSAGCGESYLGMLRGLIYRVNDVMPAVLRPSGGDF